VTIDWTHFTPASALVGGAIIGLSATILVLVNGRIAGISGILGGLVKASAADAAWRIAFIAGLLSSPLILGIVSAIPEANIEASYPLLIVAGVIVGLGTRYGSGCTSGHGVCGLSRLSPRSLVATLAFMGAGFMTVFIVRHVLAA
jgi:uncharacterized membrane protein YedE/YeeE